MGRSMQFTTTFRGNGNVILAARIRIFEEGLRLGMLVVAENGAGGR